MPISCFPGDSSNIKPELEKGRKEATEQHKIMAFIAIWAVLVAAVFAMVSGLTSAVFSKIINDVPGFEFVGLGAIMVISISVHFFSAR